MNIKEGLLKNMGVEFTMYMGRIYISDYHLGYEEKEKIKHIGFTYNPSLGSYVENI